MLRSNWETDLETAERDRPSTCAAAVKPWFSTTFVNMRTDSNLSIGPIRRLNRTIHVRNHTLVE